MWKKSLWMGLLSAIFVAVAILLLIQLKGAHHEVNQSATPTIFIHGYRGTDRSLHGMIRRFDQQYNWATDALTVKVSPTGDISVKGSYDGKQADNPLINVIFADNRATVTQQSLWTKKVMRYLQDHYNVTKFNAVGHSMGGGAWVSYLASYANKPDYPEVQKIVFLAVPFYPEEYVNGDQEVDLINANAIHAKFAKQMEQRLKSTTEIMIIGGNLEDGSNSDGEVNIDSVMYGKELFKNQYVEAHILTGPTAKHSNMHELPLVDQYVAKFLWGFKESTI
ncbi:alpha/beta fold hydrolase [Paenilisteria rocourtiae]|uniref:Putative alpha/beta hydrolase family protein n=1 Tax=Listeria rocourtiae TaxID=647910 RepID=A0A4R6ZSK8_9LIST|nr:alpha/beta fold hydrolase [Listeria rocourtiae]MBC1434591.1 alpha/beta fold hydrolase [Listeria rocourtiae]MBC1603283.1 alpha/beta fold hydrolase [Listeria rocourtiae]TDR55432.1 putative alpha/beta hydrolase family protein [Listeria rocourtiae]